MRKGTLFLKKTLSNQNKIWNNKKPQYKPYQICQYCWQKTLKMSVHTTKSRLPINSCYKFLFFLRYVYGKKWKLSIFFLFKGKRHVWMTSIYWNNHRILTGVQPIRIEIKYHQHSYVKTDINSFGHCSSHFTS